MRLKVRKKKKRWETTKNKELYYPNQSIVQITLRKKNMINLILFKLVILLEKRRLYLILSIQ